MSDSPPQMQSVYLRKDLWLPSRADEEGKRLNAQHRLLAAEARRAIHFARLKNPRAILDVGSGTGMWGVEMAQRFQQATISLLDINQHMGEQWLRVFCTTKPLLQRRLRFYPANALHPLPFEAQTFDFVHGRLMATFIPYSAWPRVVHELVRVTKPGGWIELVDGEYPQLETPAFRQMREAAMRFLGSLHLHLNASAHFVEFLEEAGVEETRQRVLRVGERPRQHPKLVENFTAAAQALREPMVAAGFIESETFDCLLPAFRQEMVETAMIWKVRAVWGQKLIAGGTAT